ncbi:MAG TPA: hypothetical protein ENN53_04615 [Candidatus Acetothermia bacterium]|nr:hypothetical protein [Candidatus Acetothermia bacterium]
MKRFTTVVRRVAFALGVGLLGFVIGTLVGSLDTAVTVILFAIALLCIVIAFVPLRRGGSN